MYISKYRITRMCTGTCSYTFTTVFCGAELGVAGPLSAAFWASPLPTVIKQVCLQATVALKACACAYMHLFVHGCMSAFAQAVVL